MWTMLPAVICRFSPTAHYTYAGSLSHIKQNGKSQTSAQPKSGVKLCLRAYQA